MIKEEKKMSEIMDALAQIEKEKGTRRTRDEDRAKGRGKRQRKNG